jgi:hypothetical protein
MLSPPSQGAFAPANFGGETMPHSPAALTPSASASAQAGNRSAMLFWADPTAAHQLLAGLAVEDQIALWFSTPQALDGWSDPALSDPFVDPFKRR